MRLSEARVGLHSSWNLDDPRAWSGVISPAVHAAENVLNSTRLAPAIAPDAPIDRLHARFSRRTVLTAHSIATARRRSLALGDAVRRASVDAVLTLASSSDLVRPLGVPTVQVTDATFDAVHDFYPLFSNLGALGSAQGRWVERRSASNTHHFVVASDWARSSLVDDIGVDAARITVAPFGPGIAPAQVRPTHRDEFAPLRLLFVSSDWNRKNGAAALQILQRLRPHREVELAIVGDAPAEASRVATLRGRLAPTELSALYSASDVLLEPSRANASGVVITDALHHGLPVLAADVGGVSTLVRPDTGWLLPEQDVVRSAAATLLRVTGSELSARSHAAAADASSRLSWTSWARALSGVEI